MQEEHWGRRKNLCGDDCGLHQGVPAETPDLGMTRCLSSEEEKEEEEEQQPEQDKNNRKKERRLTSPKLYT